MLLLCLICPACQSDLAVEVSQNSETVPPYEVFEVTFRHDGVYDDPFHDIIIDTTYTAPSGTEHVVGGFHYGSSEPVEIRGEGRDVEYIYAKQDLWKARFAPDELGRWEYEYTFANAEGEVAAGDGSFDCVEGRISNPGFLRIDPNNPYRFVFDDGSPYYPIGLQDCWGDGAGCGSAAAGASMEGPFRTDNLDKRPKLPDGPMFVRGPSTSPLNADLYFRRFAACGFNFYRFSPENCSYPLNRNLDEYLVQQGIMTDELVQMARRYGMRFMYGIFGYQKVFNEDPTDAEGMEKVKQFLKYSVDRWGAHVDIWEFLNEQKASDEWYAVMVPYLQSIDPYHHPITTSWEHPELPGIEINAPHWYEGVNNPLNQDQTTVSRARDWKLHGKPVVVGEQGNWVSRDDPRPPGIGGVWDVGSAQRMRIRNWTAFFTEISFIFWNTSYARDGHFTNIWLGPREREYVRSMQSFSYALGSDLAMVDVGVSEPGQVRAFGLASSERAGAYIHHYANHDDAVTGLDVTIDVPRDATAFWYDPATATILRADLVEAGAQTLLAPDFIVDLAVLITPNGPPDIHGDGVPNPADADDDNDGVPDDEDAFPLDPSEWADADGDLIGDVLDADDDGDGHADDLNGDGAPDFKDKDYDGDGVPNAHSVPWDAFPFDPNETIDTDGDGIGDNADADDDGDGFTDKRERKAKTDPKDRLSFPRR